MSAGALRVGRQLRWLTRPRLRRHQLSCRVCLLIQPHILTFASKAAGTAPAHLNLHTTPHWLDNTFNNLRLERAVLLRWHNLNPVSGNLSVSFFSVGCLRVCFPRRLYRRGALSWRRDLLRLNLATLQLRLQQTVLMHWARRSDRKNFRDLRVLQQQPYRSLAAFPQLP